MSSNSIWEEIQAERDKQDKQWGGPTHDDIHNPSDWRDFIEWQSHKSKNTGFREAMIKIAALAIAAIEWSDRLTNNHHVPI